MSTSSSHSRLVRKLREALGDVICAALEDDVSLKSCSTQTDSCLSSGSGSQQPMREVIGEAVDLVVSVERTATGRRVRDVMRANGFYGATYETDHNSQINEDSHAA